MSEKREKNEEKEIDKRLQKAKNILKNNPALLDMVLSTHRVPFEILIWDMKWYAVRTLLN